MLFCSNPDCFNPLAAKQKKYCSRGCMAACYRGSGKSHIRIRVNGKREYLHRIVFEKHVRPLRDGEIVHHKDENKHNNAPENLEALSGQAAHLHKHDYWRGRRKAKTLAYDSAIGW